MLKRDGENCEHPVPNYPGLLTTSEYKAYQAAIPLVAEQVRLHNERIKLLAELEKRIPEIANQIAGEEFENLLAIESWQFRHSLFKTGRSEIILCSRGTKDEEQFGVIERFDPNSPYARARGDSQEIMRSNNAYLVLQNFVEGERNVLRLYRQDIAGTVDEKLTEMFPRLNTKRVVKAITARCDSQEKQVQSEQETPAKSIKMRM
jgi:hypothetical protein